MNQFFYQITRKASEIVNSDDYRKPLYFAEYDMEYQKTL